MEHDQNVNLDQNIGMGEAVGQEKLVPQSQVDEIIKARMAAAYDKGKKEALSQAQAASQSMNSTGVTPQFSEEHFRKLAEEAASKHISSFMQAKEHELNQARVQQESARVAQKFLANLEAGKGDYEDFDQIVNLEDFQKMPNIYHLASEVDNTADVMYELSQNPAKAEVIDSLAHKNPRGALREMQKLSNSIKANKEAQQARVADDPLVPIKPSTVNSDSGSMSVSDFRKLAYLRG